MVGNVAFRSAAIGGFNRDDVMGYIERSVQENKEALEQAHAETAAAQEKAGELAQLNDELKRQLEYQKASVKAQLKTLQEEAQRVLTERDDLKEKVEQMGAMEQRMEEMDSRFQTLKRMNEQQSQELLRRENLAAEQKQRIAELEAQVERMQNDSQAYHVMCDSIGQIEMDARYRVSVMEQNAQQVCDQKLADAQSAYDSMVSSAASDAEAARRQAEGQLAQIQDQVGETITGVQQAISSALQDIDRVQEMLRGLNGQMDQYAAPQTEAPTEEKGEEECSADE